MKRRLGFIDVDSRELGEDGVSLVFRPRVEPFAEIFNRIYDLVKSHQLPMVFSTCCSGRMPREDSLPNVLFIPINVASRGWRDKVGDYSMFYAEKLAFGSPQKNSEHEAYDCLKYNENTYDLFRLLNVEEWVIFGNGLDACVYNWAKKMLKAEFKLIVLTDALVSGAKGYGNNGTEENRIAVLSELRELGAKLMTTQMLIDDELSEVPA